eukprot:TRINITY_DN88851_c0_g1_i1.p2 TRINITY_DN88851_c0_g1~~TRINITY_DN88851_c0_g1_i1.p2  ORF type:complete len:123 (-),score=2.47 TRINITY_DN88851_c0_g1_i1:9-377(-)
MAVIRPEGIVLGKLRGERKAWEGARELVHIILGSHIISIKLFLNFGQLTLLPSAHSTLQNSVPGTAFNTGCHTYNYQSKSNKSIRQLITLYKSYLCRYLIICNVTFSKLVWLSSDFIMNKKN